jgi:hypothetical protein
MNCLLSYSKGLSGHLFEAEVNDEVTTDVQ